MSLESKIATLATTIGTAIKTTRLSIGTLANLTTTNKNSLVEAVNEVKSTAGAQINDTTPSGTNVYSSNKVESIASGKVPTTRTVNGKALSTNITLAWTDFSGLLPTSALPPLAINELFSVNSQAAMLALTAQRGDMALRTDLTPARTFVLSTDSPSTLGDWVEITAAGQVTSVAGKTGAVSLVVSDVSGAQASADIGNTERDFASDFNTAMNS